MRGPTSTHWESSAGKRWRGSGRTPLERLAPDAPAALCAVIETALARRREGRYSGAAELAAALRAVAVAEPVPMLPRLVPVPVNAPARPTRDFGPPRPRPAPQVTRTPRWAGARRLGRWPLQRGVRIAVLLAVAALLGGSGAAIARRGWAGPPAEPGAAADLSPVTEATGRAGGPPPAAASVPPAAPVAPALSPSAPAARRGLAHARPPAAAPRPAARTPRAAGAARSARSARWLAVLAELDRRRAAAYASADPELLTAVYAPGAAFRLEHDRVAALAAAGERVVGLRPRHTALRVGAETPDRVTLVLTDVLPAYRRLDERGSVLERYPGRAAVRWSLTLLRDGARWRIRAIAAAE
ncbi:MAG TPA: hypothetical protein VEZ46_15485 [Mycobacteriales bacterium]|nr:hypothetical protein [Mycobacteriales bacterium]